jgi:hypothetical protein
VAFQLSEESDLQLRLYFYLRIFLLPASEAEALILDVSYKKNTTLFN